MVCVLDEVEKLVKKVGDSFVFVECVLIVLVVVNMNVCDVLVVGKVNVQVLNVVINDVCKGCMVDIVSVEDSYEVLLKYVCNLIEVVVDGKIDLIIGWDEEICCVMQVLLCCIKNNLVLIGEFGVGKIVIVEGLVLCIIDGDVFESLCNKQFWVLDMGVLIVGVKYCGEFEEWLKVILKEIENVVGEVILFIDELYVLVGVGKIDGVMDVVNLIKFVLVWGELYCVGVIMLDEYCKYIEKDVVLVWCFQFVLVQEFMVEDMISILCGIKEKYELYYGVCISDVVLVVVV